MGVWLLGARGARSATSPGRSRSCKVSGLVGAGPLGLALLLGLLVLFPGGAEASGPWAYISNFSDGTVSVIDTATNTVTATVMVGAGPLGVAVTPDGAHVYVVNSGDNTVSVIATATNTVGAPVPVGACPFGVAVTPDGAHVYVTNSDNTISVIATATNTVGAPVPVGLGSFGVAVTPDGAHVYVVNSDALSSHSTVSVIATADNTVGAMVTVGMAAFAFGQFIGPPQTVPFASFTARVEIERAHTLKKHAGDSFEVRGRGVLGQTSDGIAPNTEAVTLSLGSLSLTIPAGSFVKKIDKDEDNDKSDRERGDHDPVREAHKYNAREDRDERDDAVTTYHFKGVIAGVSLNARIEQGPVHMFRFQFKGRNANLGLVVNPVTVGLVIGNDVGHVAVKADIDK